jgi:hypothetical protein
MRFLIAGGSAFIGLATMRHVVRGVAHSGANVDKAETLQFERLGRGPRRGLFWGS